MRAGKNVPGMLQLDAYLYLLVDAGVFPSVATSPQK